MYVFIHVLHSPFKLPHVHNIVHRSVPDLHCRIHTIQYCLASHQMVDCGPCEHLVATQIANLLSTQPWPRQHRSNVMFVTHHAQHQVVLYVIYAPMLHVCSNMTGHWSWAVSHCNHQLTRNKKQHTQSRHTTHPHKRWKQQSTATSCHNSNPCGTMTMA